MSDTTTSTLEAPPGLFARFDAAMTLDDDALARLRWMAVVGLVVLNLADLVVTRRALALGGVEANPLMAPIIHGTWGVAVKAGLPVVIGYRHLRAPLRRPLVLGLTWMCVVYSAVVCWNLHLLTNPHLLG